MTPDEFAGALEAELRLHGIPFVRGELRVFVEDCWPPIAKDPDVDFWAREFLDRLEGQPPTAAPPFP